MKKIYLSFLTLLLSIGIYAQQNGLTVCGVVTNLSPNTVNTVVLTVYSGSGAQTVTSMLSTSPQFCMPSVPVGLDSSGVANYYFSIAVNNCPPVTQTGVYLPNSANVSVTLQGGCTVTTTCTASIGAMPVLGTTLSTLTATSTGTAPFAYIWNTGATTQTINTNPMSSYYSVTITDALGCAAFAAYTDSIVLPACSATIQLPANNLSNDLTANGTGVAPFGYAWSMNGTPINNVQNSNTLNAQQAGTYCVTITDATGCATTDCVYYSPNPTSNNCNVSFYAMPDSMGGPGTVGGLMYFFSVANGVAPYTYNWFFSDGTSSTQANPTHIFTYGNYNINWATLTITDATGCVSSSSQQIYVQSPIPQCSVYFDSYSNYSPSTPGEIMFQSYANLLGAPVTYSWDFGDGSPISTSANPTHTYAASGNYNVCLTININGCPGTYCQTNYVDLSWWTNNPYNSGNCNAGYILVSNPGTVGMVTIVDISQVSNPVYSWTGSAGMSSNSQTPFFTINGSGDFVLCLTVSDSTNNCTSTFCDTLTVDSVGGVFKSMSSTFNGTVGLNVIASAKPFITTGIENINNSNIGIELMPNPASDNVTLKMFSNKQETATVNLVDLSGKVVMTEILSQNKGINTSSINVSAISNGIYFVKVICSAETKVMKLNVKH
jgi:PKD repeat protein